MDECELFVAKVSDTWRIAGSASATFGAMNEYLSYLRDRNYSAMTIRAYGYSLVAFGRWLLTQEITLEEVSTTNILDYLHACRLATVPGRSCPNVVRMDGTPLDGYAPATINHRLGAISSLFRFLSMRDPEIHNPIPRGTSRRRRVSGERNGTLSHLARGQVFRSELRLREPRLLPHTLAPREISDLLDDFRSVRDLAMAGLMVYSGLRSAEVLGLLVHDVDIGARWVRVLGKGAKERRVPIDIEVSQLIQTYLLVERPESEDEHLFLVAKGKNRGHGLSVAGLRTIFRYHRLTSGVTGGNPHSLRHSFGTAMAAAGVDLAVIQALLGHTHIDTTQRYIHLAPIHVKEAFDAARARAVD